MESLQELSQIVTRNKLKAINIFDLCTDAQTKASQLYQLIVDKKVEPTAKQHISSILRPIIPLDTAKPKLN